MSGWVPLMCGRRSGRRHPGRTARRESEQQRVIQLAGPTLARSTDGAIDKRICIFFGNATQE